MKSGIERIAEERRRQIEVEGWTPDHDKQHDREQLLEAAYCYMTASIANRYSKNCVTFDGGYRVGEGVPSDFPSDWDKAWWKPSTDPIRNLEKAGALIAAEIDRLSAE